MVSSNSLDEYIGGTVKHYSSLFTLPSREKIILSLLVLCILGGALGILLCRPSYSSFALGLIFGGSVFLVVIASDLVISRFFMIDDPIFNFRRCSALSLFSNLIWLGIILLGSIIGFFLENPGLWTKFFLLGFCAVLMVRLIVFSATSFANSGRVFLSSVLQPVLYMIPAFFAGPATGFGLTVSLILFVVLSVSVVGLTALLFTFFVNRVGKQAVGIPSLSLFKAFMANWTEDLNAPLESFFERLGSERDVGLSLLAFKGSRGVKAMMVVPAFHPGPFKNVGSSLFPSMIQDALENKLQCVVSVPHGLIGHGLDLSSQVQNRRVIESAFDSMDFPYFESNATPFMRVEKNGASSSCQVFGDCAFIALTLAPETMEDLPEELNSTIVSEAEKRGVSSAIIVDAHNSIDGHFNLAKAIGPLRIAAVSSLEKAVNCQRCPLEVGASRIVPKEFGIREGVGPGGISVVVTKVEGQKAAYVTVDGNNMISGLREKILSMLRDLGIVDGEVLTTDTHAVNGVVLTPRGYHPIGEAMDQWKLIEYVKDAAIRALNDLEPVEVSWCMKTISNIKVIGEQQVRALCALTEKAARQAKIMAATLFPMAGTFLTVMLVFV